MPKFVESWKSPSFIPGKQTLYQLTYSSIYGIRCLGQEFECKMYTWYMKEAGKEWIKDRNEKAANLLVWVPGAHKAHIKKVLNLYM